MPSSPLVPPTPTKSEKDLPSDSGWDTAETVTSLPPEAAAALPIPEAAPTPKGGIVAPVSSAPSPPAPVPTPTPSPAAMTKSGRSVPPPAASTSPGATLQSLSAPQREEVWAIVRAAIGEATAPMLSKHRELEERVLRAEQAAASASANAKAGSVSITGPSISPDGPRPPQKSMRLSVPPGVYGVAVIDPGERKPEIDTANVVISDMPNFGRTKWPSRIIAGVVILLLGAAVISMIVSRS